MPGSIRTARRFGGIRAVCLGLVLLAGTSPVRAGLPPGWSDADIGAPAQGGSASYTNGLWTVSGGGADIWGTSDQFNFASQAASGDAEVVALVTSQQNTDPGAKAGVMFRNDTTAGAMDAAVVVTPSNSISFQWRPTTGGQCSNQVVAGVGVPVWLKLVRSGNSFSAYYSTDSANWTQVGTNQVVDLNDAALAGLAVTAHNNALLSTASFSYVSVAPSAAVLTQRNDNARTGQNTNETLLTLANVNANSFGLLFSHTVDGNVYAQPLVMTNVAITGKGVHRVVYVATENDSVYAFDADNDAGANAAPLWQASFINPAAGITPVPSSEASLPNIQPVTGITGTPVIDPAAGTIYLEVRTKEVSGGTTTYPHRFHALDIATGLERPGSPVIITSTNYPGTGTPGYADNDGAGHVLFNNLREHSRTGLLLVNGAIYFGYASPGDYSPYHGWVFGYNGQTLAQQGVFNTTPNGGLGGIWMAGSGLCADSEGYIYFESGNGSFDGPTNNDYADSILKLSTSVGLTLNDYFTPYDQAYLANQDLDLGSGGSVVLPDSAGSTQHPHLLLGASKTGDIYLVDRDAMGKFDSTNNYQIVQWINGAVGGMWNTPAYFNGMLYYIGVSDHLKAFSISNAAINPTPAAGATNSFGYPGASPSVSANGTNQAIIWALEEDGNNGGQAVLHAYNATNVAQELYNSSQVASRDSPGGTINYNVPTVANGKVYVGTANSLAVFGNALFVPEPLLAPSPGLFTNFVTVTLSDAMAGAAIYYTLDGTTPTTNSLRYSMPFTVTNSTTVTAFAVAPGALNSPLVSAKYVNSLDAPPSITSIYPDGSMLFQWTNFLAFTIVSKVGITNLSVQLLATNQDGSGSAQVLTNGAGLTLTGPGTNLHVTTPLTSNMVYVAVIYAADANGSLTQTDSFDTIVPGFTWEAEDWDYNGGQFIDNPQTNAYAGLVATLNVDGYNPNNPSSGAYRPTPSTGSSGNLGNEVASDKPRAQYTTGQIDYDQGYNNGGSGLWGNYTRHYPAGRWNIFMRGAGWADSSESAVLYRGGINGTLLGQFNVPDTATAASTYQNYTWVPLVDSGGNLIEWDTDGSQQTLTVMTEQGNYNANFYMLLPINPSYRPNPFVSNVSPSGTTTMFSPTNVFSFTANSVPGITTNGVVLLLNGVPAFGVTFSGTAHALNVSCPLATNVVYTVSITLTDSYGTSTYTTSFATFSANNYTWEAEDWDYNGAHFFDNPQVNAYAGRSGIAGVDANNTQGGGTAYRANDSGDLGNEVTGDLSRAQYVNANANDYDAGWTAAGNWANYTRNYPAGAYYVYLRGASPNGQNDAISLWQVTSGVGTASQTLSPLGQFNVPLTGGWQNWAWVPLINANGGYALITNSGAVSTIRMNEDNGGWNANFFMLVSTSSVPLPPAISQLYPNGSSLFQRTNTLSFVVNSGVPLSSNNVTVTINGVVLNNLIFSGSPNSLGVSWPYLKPNTVYSATIAVRSPNNANGSSLSYVFDTFSSSYYTWEAEDWDYNGAHFIDNPQTDGYAGLSGSPGVDADNTSGGTAAYRPGNTGDLANEVASDIRRAQYINANANDYDIGYTAGGNWANYTRTYPKGIYNVYMRMASPNGQNDAASLWQVTSGVGTTTQALSPLGQFNVPLTGGWQTYTWVPLVNGSGNLLTITNSGTVSTFRVNEDNGGWNGNFFLLVPIGFDLNVALNNGIVNISFPTLTNVTYQIEYKLHLSDSSWAPLGSSVPGTGGFVSVQDRATGGGRFYRGVASGPP